MRTTNVNFNTNYIGKPYFNNVKFTGILHIDKKNGNINDSWFFRDEKILASSADHIKTFFPEGADVLIYGCSVGEENISFKSFVPESKYRVIGYDTSTDALRIGKRGVYSLFSNWHDSYLMPNMNYPLAECELANHSKEECIKMQELRRKFHEIMYEVPASEEYRDINNKYGFIVMKYQNKNFVEKFYRVRDKFTKQIDLRFGNFINVGQIKKERPVGGIFFRNAIYHLCGNNVNEVLNFNAPVQICHNIDKLMEYAVSCVHKTLDNDGIFVIGNHIKEHLYLADDLADKSKTISFCDTPYFVESNIKHQEYRNLKFYKESPLLTALLKDGNFEPIKYSVLSAFGSKIEVPVMFKKVRI